MYKNFSDASVQVIMRAHKLAVELKLPEMDALVLLLALLMESSKALRKAESVGVFFLAVRDKLESRPKVEMVPFPLKFDEATEEAFKWLSRQAQIDGTTVEPEDFYGSVISLPAISAWLGQQTVQTVRPARSPREWFGTNTFAVLDAAGEDARKTGCEHIEVQNLISGAAAQIDWLPNVIRAGISALRDVPGGNVAVQMARDLELSPAAVEVICAARNRAEVMARDAIEPDHILWAALGTVNKELQELLIEAIDEHARQSVANRPLTYVSIDETRVWMAPRLVALLKRVHAFTVADYIEALYEEAKKSETAFMLNRTGRVDAILKNLREFNEKMELRTLLQKAVSQAVQLGSPRLDLNHVALALLALESEAVTLAVMAIVDPEERKSRPKMILQRRLEMCTIYQVGRTDLITGPSVEVDLDALDSL
jgi:hypothetical protein